MAKIKRYVEARESVGPHDKGLFTFLLLEALAGRISDEEWESALKEASERTKLYQMVVDYTDSGDWTQRRTRGSLESE